MIDDVALGEILAMLRRVVEQADQGGQKAWNADNPLFPALVELLEEARAWRSTRPFWDELLGDCRGGAAAEDPYVDWDMLRKHGLVEHVPFDPEKHGDPKNFGLDAGDDHYVLTPITEKLLGVR